MRTQMTNVADILAMGHGQVVPELVVKLINVCRPYKQTDRDKEYKWHRQLVNLEGGDGLRISMIIYTEKMHLGSENEGQVWRFRCLPSDTGGPRGLEVNKWQKSGSQEINVELKLNNWADAGRLSFLEGAQESKQEAPKESKPATPEVAPEKVADKKPNPDEVEELVMADIKSRRDLGRVKYGTSMERTDVDPQGWAQHAYEEFLDGAIYLRRFIRDLDQQRLVLVPAERYAHLLQMESTLGESTNLETPAFPKKETPRSEGAPVEKAMRSTANPKGSEPFKEEKPPRAAEEAPWDDTPPASEPEPEKAPPRQEELPPARRPAGGGNTPERNEEIEKTLHLKFVARYVRDAYDDEADDAAVEQAHKCLKIMKDHRYRWTEVFDTLTAKTKSENPGLVGKAFYRIKDQLNEGREEKDHRTDEQVAEAICKKPSALREALDHFMNQG